MREPENQESYSKQKVGGKTCVSMLLLCCIVIYSEIVIDNVYILSWYRIVY